MNRLSALIGVLGLLLLQGCDFFERKSKSVVVAECYGKYLYESDLQGIVPENTSALDSISEKMIQEAVNNLTRGRTTFIVAHRLSTIKEADSILVMKNGHIVEMGNHESLLKKRGFYYLLYNSQFES